MKKTRKQSAIHTAYPVRTETMSPARFARIFATEKGNFESVKIVPGKLGDKSLGGKIVVRHKTPIYRTPFAD